LRSVRIKVNLWKSLGRASPPRHIPHVILSPSVTKVGGPNIIHIALSYRRITVNPPAGNRKGGKTRLDVPTTCDVDLTCIPLIHNPPCHFVDQLGPTRTR